MKRLICLLLCLVTLISMGSVSAWAATPETVAPYYNNVDGTQSSFSIDENGYATLAVPYIGYPGITTGATITIKLQKRGAFGLYWSDVNLTGDDATDNMIVINSNEVAFSKSYGIQLNFTGTYRAVINYTIYGTAGAADQDEDVLTYTYS